MKAFLLLIPLLQIKSKEAATDCPAPETCEETVQLVVSSVCQAQLGHRILFSQLPLGQFVTFEWTLSTAHASRKRVFICSWRSNLQFGIERHVLPPSVFHVPAVVPRILELSGSSCSRVHFAWILTSKGDPFTCPPVHLDQGIIMLYKYKISLSCHFC